MRVFVTGGGGFIGGHVVAALKSAGHDVVAAVHAGRDVAGGQLPCDFSRDLDPEVWIPRIAGCEAVVNCAGVLRETGQATFARVHCEAPMALFRACAAAGVRRVVQISALGDARDTAFVATKHQCDAALAQLDLSWTVLRPSLVYSPAGSFGGTSLLRAMAALPGVICVPGTGMQTVQPIAAEDLAHAVVMALERDAAARRVVEAVGPQVLGLTQFLSALRTWLRLPRARIVNVPAALVALLTLLADRFVRGPLGATMRVMLERGNVGAVDAVPQFTAAFGFPPRALDQVLDTRPSQVQDRWHARLYLLRPLLLGALSLVWIGSGVVGLATETEAAARMWEPLRLSASTAAALVSGASALDLALGLLLWWPRARRLALQLMLASVLAYTLVLGVAAPSTWLDPAGGLLKNLLLLPALAIMLALEDQR